MRAIFIFTILYLTTFSAYAVKPVSVDVFTLLGDNANFISLTQKNIRQIDYNTKSWDVNSEIANTMAAALRGLGYKIKLKFAEDIKPAMRKIPGADANTESLAEIIAEYNKSSANFVMFILPLTLNHSAAGIELKGYGSNGHETMGIIDLFLHVKVYIFDTRTKKLAVSVLSPNYIEFADSEREYSASEVNKILHGIKNGGSRDPDLVKYRTILLDANLTMTKKVKEVKLLYAEEFVGIIDETDGENNTSLDLVKLNTLLRPLHHTPLTYPNLPQVEKNKIDKQMEKLQKNFVSKIISKIKDSDMLVNTGIQ